LFVKRDEEREMTISYFSKLRVRTPSVTSPVAGLSGGNQQKVVLARWLAASSRILILDEPTRGVDVGAKAEIHALVRDLAARGNAVLIISSELPEVIALSHRILVMRQGQFVAEVTHADATQEKLLRLMAGVGPASAA
jgi:ABC-type sugar transport system ATPase subunit